MSLELLDKKFKRVIIAMFKELKDGISRCQENKSRPNEGKKINLTYENRIQ